MNTEARWTIRELAELSERVLRELGYDRAPSGRVRALPDVRTIRYYTTIGLLDRPAEMRGRVAYYGLRHLLQLMAIKKLQAEGLALNEIQRRVIGLSDEELKRLVGVPDDLWSTLLREFRQARAVRGTPEARRKAFWKLESPGAAGQTDRAEGGERCQSSRGFPVSTGEPRVVGAVHLLLAPWARLVFEGLPVGERLSDADIRRLCTAARPLMRELEELRVRMGVEARSETCG